VKAVVPGDRGLAVSDVQKRLHDLGFTPPDFEHEIRQAYYGRTTTEAVRDFQEKRGLKADGNVDETTWQELVEASFSLGDRFLYLRIPPFRGDDVRKIQSYLNRLGFNAGREDGIFGQDTDQAVRSFQHNMGLPVDGIAGSSTISFLLRLKHAFKDTSVAEVHEALQDQAIRGLEGRQVVLDAAEGDAGAERLLRASSDELLSHGVSAMITGGSSGQMPESQRARLANDREADLVIGLRPSPGSGFHVFFFGTSSYSSPRGKRLAEILYEEIQNLEGLEVTSPQMKTYPLLRETRMPCVIVESPQNLDNIGGLAMALARSIVSYFHPQPAS
jgi:N-acetylmuramoyl-L-alanine amidase